MNQLWWLTSCLAEVPEHNEWLTGRERACLSRLKVEKRRREWRLGRWTAKAALRAAWWSSCGCEPGQVLEILAAEDGAPELHGAFEPVPAFSLSHSGNQALCAVARPGQRVGCDLEQVEPRIPALVTDFFTTRERDRALSAPPELQPLVTNLIWSAKESALKARRTGLRADTRSVEVAWEDQADQSGWLPLQVRVAGEAAPLAGWWRTLADCVLTLVADPPTAPPLRLLSGLPF
jgi:4'-phosphopantetheinyl transferase